MAGVLKTYAGLDRSIYFLFIAQVVNSVGHFVHPFLTLLLTRKLGMDAGEAGFYVFLSAMAWVPGSLAGGRIADSWGRKKAMVLFHTLPALALVPCAFLGASRLVAWLLIGVSFLYGLAEPVNDAMLIDLTAPEQRKPAFSLLYLGHNIGIAVGPSFAGILFNRYLTWFFLADAATTLAAVALIALFVRESAPSRERIEASFRHDSGPERAERGSLLAVLLRRPFLLAFMFINVLISLVYSQSQFSLPLQCSELFGERGPRTFGLLVSLNGLAVIALTTVVLRFTRRLAPVLTVAAAGLFYAAGFGLIGLVGSLPWLLLSTLIWTLGEILAATSTGAYIASHSPLTHRGRVNAVAPIIMYSGMAAGPPLAGRLIELSSLAMIWPCTFALSLAAALLLALLHWRERAVRRRAAG
jgi:predicted MFS family arabinose efflux permease